MVESVHSNQDIKYLENNKIMGEPQFNNSIVLFNGSNNILFCEDGVNLTNSKIQFNGNNSIIYLSSSKYKYKTQIFVFNDSTVFIGKDNNINATLRINVQESQNVIIGDDCVIGPNVDIRTSDGFPVFSGSNKKRINLPSSVIIGDHVWLGHLSYLSRGVKLGSGSIVYNNTNVLPHVTVKSNSYYANGQVISDNVFFMGSHTAYFDKNDIESNEYCQTDEYIYEEVENETLSLVYIDSMLDEYEIIERLEFIQKLLVEDKKKNRFAIE